MKIQCSICDNNDENRYCMFFSWCASDSRISLPHPPDDLFSATICNVCYKDGETMEQRIRNKKHSPKCIHMEDGTSGYVCAECTNYFPFVEPNSNKGYVCYNCR